MLLLNTGGERKVEFNVDLDPWLESESGTYAVKSYDANGNLVESLTLGSPAWQGSTGVMQHLDIALFEFIAE